MFICKICEKEYEKVSGLLTHIQFNHKEYTPETYYRTFLMTDSSECNCKTCGKPVPFHNIQVGYRKYCNKKCAWQDPEIKQKRAETISKMSDTQKKEWRNKNKEAHKDIITGKYISKKEQNKRQEISENHFKEYLNKCNCDFIKYDKRVYFKCRKCNTEDSFVRSLIDRYDRNGDYDLCHYCNDKRYVSQPEHEIRKFISKIYAGKIISGDRKLLNGKELDIVLPDIKLAIEYDGLYWHNDTVVKSDYHLCKTILCEKLGYQLIHIFENEWLEKREIVESRIKCLLAANNRIFARKCEIKEISYKDSELFLNENHIQGNCVSKWRYGLYYNNELVSIMTFGKSRFKDEYEMLRFANKKNTNVIGGASKLFSHFTKQHADIQKIVTYADRRWSKGNLYEKLNFKKVGNTAPSYFYIINHKLHNRVEFQKHKLVADGYDSNKTEHEIMKERGINRIYDCGCIKYEWFNDTKSVIPNK